MKANYIQPITDVLHIQITPLLAGSAEEGQSSDALARKNNNFIDVAEQSDLNWDAPEFDPWGN